MTDTTLRQALAYARHGWPVFPCLPGQKIPATQHGYQDATSDEQQITEWFGRGFTWNLAIATGTPGPDVLDIDQHGEAGNGYPAFATLERARLVDGASAYVRTPAGGMHAYFTGSGQHNGRLPSHHLDFRSQGGYILAPPSQVDGNPYLVISRPGGHGTATRADPRCMISTSSMHRLVPTITSANFSYMNTTDYQFHREVSLTEGSAPGTRCCP